MYSIRNFLNCFDNLIVKFGNVTLITLFFKFYILQNSEKILKVNKYLKTGDKYIITAGAPVGVTGNTNMLKIHSA